MKMSRAVPMLSFKVFIHLYLITAYLFLFYF